MSGQTILLIVLLVLIGGIVLLGLAVYLFFVLKTVRDLTQSLNRAVEVLKPLTEKVGLSDVLNQVTHASKVAIELGRRTEVLTETLKMMHNAIFAGKVPNLEAPTDANVSGFFTATEEDVARKEVERQLRARGVKVGSEAYEPKEEEGVTEPEQGS